MSEIKALRERPVILVCKTDGRSARARVLAAAGFGDVQVLRGGMMQWNTEGRPATGVWVQPASAAKRR